MHIGRSRKGFGCRLAGLARTADRGKEIVQAGRQIGPSHLKLIRAIIDDLVSDAGCGVDGRARDEWVRHSVDDNGALSREAEQDLLVGRMRMLAHIPAGRDDLYPHRKIIGASVFGAQLDDRVAVRPNRLPVRLPLFRLQHDARTSRLLGGDFCAHKDLPRRVSEANSDRGSEEGQV